MRGDQVALVCSHSAKSYSVEGASSSRVTASRLLDDDLVLRRDSQPHLDLSDDVVSVLLGVFGDDQLIAVPRVADLRVGKSGGELGHLLERPIGQVVVHPGRVGIVRVPIVGHVR